jgi:hypothetical protein
LGRVARPGQKAHGLHGDGRRVTCPADVAGERAIISRVDAEVQKRCPRRHQPLEEVLSVRAARMRQRPFPPAGP